MKVLRDNKESLMAVLEAFVYDPLINWRLMQAEPETRPPDCTIFVVLAEAFPGTNLRNCVAELRSQELTRVAGYPQGPLRKLKADENDIFNGNNTILCRCPNHVVNDPPLRFQRLRNREMNVPLWCTTGCSTSSLVRTTRMIELCFFASRKRGW